MDQITLAYEQLLEKIVAWARPRTDISALIIIGSRARADRPADQWSDLDIALFVTDPESYLANAAWLEDIDEYTITFLEPTATSNGTEMERRVLFRGSLDVDFAFVPVQDLESTLAAGLSPADVFVFRRGMRVLLDRDGLADRIIELSAEPAPYRPPSQEEFLNAINDFWYHAVWMTKKLRRGELWVAKNCCDGYMKRLLLRMIEWHTHAWQGDQVDTWHNGRFLEQWADPRLCEALRTAFAHYDEADIHRALLSTMDTFRLAAAETAAYLDYPYPTTADRSAATLVDTLLPPDKNES